MKVFISGGCKSGKSLYAQQLSKKMQKADKPLYYIATMIATDREDEKRIARHCKERDGWGFETIEAGTDVVSAIGKCDFQGAFLLDSVTALLANLMFKPSGKVEHEAPENVEKQLKDILFRINDIVIVSDFIYSDAIIYDNLTEEYRCGLARIDKQVAYMSDVVLELFGGNRIVHKGARLLNEFD